jgi:uncharacterized protein DUF3631
MLLADIRQAFLSDMRLPTRELIARLSSLEERPWGDYRDAGCITNKQLAKLLHPFGIKSTTFRQGDETPKGYVRADFADAFDRYLP